MYSCTYTTRFPNLDLHLQVCTISILQNLLLKLYLLFEIILLKRLKKASKRARMFGKTVCFIDAIVYVSSFKRVHFIGQSDRINRNTSRLKQK